MDIFFIRHTETVVEKGVCYGISDVSLKDASFENFHQQKAKLPQQFDEVISSPLKRCLQLAHHLTDKEIITDERLIELDFGNWEMKPWSEIPETEITPWMNDFVTISPPNGESFVTLAKRTSSFVDELRNRPEKTILVVAHAGSIRAMLSEVLSIPLKESFKLHLDFGGIIQVEIKKDPTFDKLISFNI